MTDHARMRFFGTLHPAVSMCYFVCVIGLTLACPHVVTVLLSLLGSTLFNLALRGRKAFGRTMRFVLPMFLIVCIGNPLVNHRGVTMLFLLFDQWITLEAIVYGIVTACSLAAIILWFGCYQEVMTSDKFVYLFGRVIPALSLVLSMALRFIPKFKAQMQVVSEAQACIGRDTKNGSVFRRAGNAEIHSACQPARKNVRAAEDQPRKRGFVPGFRATMRS